MAAENGRKSAGLSDLLLREPYRFDFFQAVRLLGFLARERAADGGGSFKPVGNDYPPEQEPVRFRTLASLTFSAGPVSDLHQASQRTTPGREPLPLEMVVSFLGLTGPNGAMPYHYTRLLLRRLRDKDFSLRDFLDLFNHRLVSMFYRVWEKYHLPFAFERTKIDLYGPPTDAATQGLYCLVGLGTAGLRGRLGLNDEAILFYGGHFSHFPRSATSLEAMLQELFEMPVSVLELQGQWLSLGQENMAVMPNAENPQGLNNQLGVDVIAGERIFDVQNKIRLRVGPLKLAKFRRLLPNGDLLRLVRALTTFYIGPELDFDVQLVLDKEEVPWCQLGAEAEEPPYLGLNTWVRLQQFERDVDDTVFFLDEI